MFFFLISNYYFFSRRAICFFLKYTWSVPILSSYLSSLLFHFIILKCFINIYCIPALWQCKTGSFRWSNSVAGCHCQISPRGSASSRVHCELLAWSAGIMSDYIWGAFKHRGLSSDSIVSLGWHGFETAYWGPQDHPQVGWFARTHRTHGHDTPQWEDTKQMQQRGNVHEVRPRGTRSKPPGGAMFLQPWVWQRITRHTYQGRSLVAWCQLFYWELVMWHLLPGIPKFQTLRRTPGIQHKPYCLYKQLRHSETLWPLHTS